MMGINEVRVYVCVDCNDECEVLNGVIYNYCAGCGSEDAYVEYEYQQVTDDVQKAVEGIYDKLEGKGYQISDILYVLRDAVNVEADIR